jgi:hypothetical protein
MALTVGRASEDRAQERDMVAARDPFHIFHVQLTAAHPIEHPIIVVARHKFLLLYRVRTEAPACGPRFRSLPFLRFKKTPWQLLVQDIVWIADWAGCQGAGERIRRRRDLFHFFLGE